VSESWSLCSPMMPGFAASIWSDTCVLLVW
jgi:hypothetical protein